MHSASEFGLEESEEETVNNDRIGLSSPVTSRACFASGDPEKEKRKNDWLLRKSPNIVRTLCRLSRSSLPLISKK